MKKIGIFTFHRSINYGAFMQAYSLSKKLQSLNPNVKVEIVDYTSAIMQNIYSFHFNLSTLKHPISAFLKSKQRKKFKEALNRLPLSSKHICSDGNTDEVLSAYENNYDVFVVGSDAVWNWCKRGFPNPYLLNFKNDSIKLSYAASSFGMGKETVSDMQKTYFRSSLEKFSFIGVRDEYTAQFVKEVCPTCEPVFTCDPTVFLDLNDVYSELNLSKVTFKDYIYKKFGIPKGKKLIGVMGAPCAVVKKLKEIYGDDYLIVSLYNCTKEADIQMINISPFEWAAVFGLFELTITSFFHGTLLSLRNHTPVINVDFNDFSKTYEGKIHDVMRRMDLLECHFNNKGDTDKIINQVSVIIEKRSEYSTKIKTNLEILQSSSRHFFEKIKEFT